MHQATSYLIHSTTTLQLLLDATHAAILRLAGCNWWAYRLIEI
jgi:hypothetical protein